MRADFSIRRGFAGSLRLNELSFEYGRQLAGGNRPWAQMFPLQAPVPASAVATRSSTEVEAVASGGWGTVVRGDLQATASSKKAASSLSIGRPQYHAGGYFDGVRRKGRPASGAREAARPEGEKQGGPLLRGKAEPTFSPGQAGGGVDDRTAHLPVPDGSSGDRAGSGHDGGQV